MRAHLNDPHQIAPLSDGGFLVADTGNNVIRKVDAHGEISTVAGTPMQAGNAGDGGAATAAKLNAPMGVADLGGGAYAIADTGNAVVRIVDSAGTITTRASDARFAEPRTVMAIGGGSLLVVDADLDGVFTLSAEGVRTVVAGFRGAGSAGDGGPATAAQLNRPTSAELDGFGGTLIADAGNGAVRHVGADGTITTVASVAAGTTAGRRLEALPTAVAVGSDGRPLIGAGPNIEGLDADGLLRRVAGTRRSGFDFDAGPALEVTLGQVSALAPTARGVLIADADDDRVRLLTPDNKLLTVAGANHPASDAIVGLTGGARSPPYPGQLAPTNKGNCPGKPASSSFRVTFFYLRAMTVHPGRVKVRLRVSDDAHVTVTVTRLGMRHDPRKLGPRSVRRNVHPFSLGKLRVGDYALAARASVRRGKRRVFSCATASLRVTKN